MERRAEAVAATWPASADLGSPAAPGPEDPARFLQALPDFDQLSHQARQFALSTGLLRVSLARLLSRWRPEVAAFLLPCGQFLLPSQVLLLLLTRLLLTTSLAPSSPPHSPTPAAPPPPPPQLLTRLLLTTSLAHSCCSTSSSSSTSRSPPPALLPPSPSSPPSPPP